ncbi:Predicted nucleic acid-binding protein, contains PIN domain [Hydrobacter penzbergensis]|uniref:Predicted nucleic acid-binding protein, contains PIN domain n=1 Tax=Hydrobacter penzbergensis TaxID=1235997 RepID=A0A8X8IA68_9BACT|nr:PIN domain-containing protein [Hydrobacter penzbergensis]SDW41159.1 Predicted nucleic acid-binding protein, contains PIN domain [Hydrobacter penzbergensis]
MAFKVFLDANILLDFTLNRDNSEQARRVVALAVEGGIQAFITPSVVHILGHYLSKEYGNTKAKELLLGLLADITVIDLPHEIAVNALHSKITDIEDALQYYTAIHHKLDYFISRDKQLKKQGVPALAVYTPEEFLKEFES